MSCSFPVGLVAVERKLASCPAKVKPGDRLVELNGQSLTQSSFKEVMSLLRKLPVGVPCSFVFHRLGAEAAAPPHLQSAMQALEAPPDMLTLPEVRRAGTSR